MCYVHVIPACSPLNPASGLLTPSVLCHLCSAAGPLLGAGAGAGVGRMRQQLQPAGLMLTAGSGASAAEGRALTEPQAQAPGDRGLDGAGQVPGHWALGSLLGMKEGGVDAGLILGCLGPSR